MGLSPKVAYLTAGAAGMYCGSCMRDNTLASALRRQLVDIQLIPTYTPIRTDEENVSVDEVFFGGINIYLQQKLPLFRTLPKFLDRFLDNPRLIQWATRKTTQANPKLLGNLTVSMLKGVQGFQQKEVVRLCEWFEQSFSPQLINLSNALIAGCVPELKKRLQVPVIITLQGDDIFLEELSTKHRRQAIHQIQRIDEDVDGYIVFSQYYADFMAQYMGLPIEKFRIVPLGIDTREFQSIDRQTVDSDTVSIGYLARLAPEKGLHLLVDAFIRLHQEYQLTNTRLLIAGWMGEHRKSYVQEQIKKLHDAGLAKNFQNFGTLDRQEKIDFLKRVDLLSVPTTYQEPKGLFVLEALAAGIPCIQPNHGAFPELIDSTEGGVLFRANDVSNLAAIIAEQVQNRSGLSKMGNAGRRNVIQNHNADTMAQATLKVYREFL